MVDSDKSESLQNPFKMSEGQILDQIKKTHVLSEKSFDKNSLLYLAGNILGHSTHVVDNLIQVSGQNKYKTEDKNATASFSSPLCTLKQISSEMSCKQPGDEIAHKTTLTILKKLSHYEWDVKAVFVLAAFALEYGEFWLLSSQLQATNPIAKSLAVLKKVSVLTKPEAIQQQGHAIFEFNNLIKTTLQVIESIFEFENLNYDTKRVPALAPVLREIPIYVYWVIIAVVAIVTQIDCITTESEQRHGLSSYSQQINLKRTKLTEQIELCRQQKYEADYFLKIDKLLARPTKILDVIKLLIFQNTDVSQQLYDGTAEKMVKIDVLEEKNIFLFISTLDITDAEISVVLKVYDHIKEGDQYTIVWIPIEEGWNNDNLKDRYSSKFESLKTKMKWYVVQQFSFTLGYKFIKQEWHFKKQPMVVVMSKDGEVMQKDAFHVINSYGMRAFPFTADIVKNPGKESDWIEHVIGSLHPNIAGWIREKKYIFFYGGSDDWIKEFTEAAEKLQKDEVIQHAKISIELFSVEDDKTLKSKFWSRIESLFVTKIHKKHDAVTKEVHKMFSYRNKTGWALLSKGSSVVHSGHGSTISKAVAEFKQWGQITAENFQTAFIEYHMNIVKKETTHPCCVDLEILNVSGELPESLCCAECSGSMETYIHYKCCQCNKKIPTTNGAH